MGGDKLPPGPEGRGPFDASDTFVLPDGRSYTPGDACTDDIYGCHPDFSHPALAEKCGQCVRCGARCGALARAGRGARGGGPGAGVVLPPRARPWGSRWWWATAVCQRVPMCMLDCAHACRRVRATRHKEGVYITYHCTCRGPSRWRSAWLLLTCARCVLTWRHMLSCAGKALEEPVQVGDDFKMLALGAGVRAVV